jgi:nucleoside-diphosphate-sugar epimerase
MSHILVTGASGFIGSHLVRHLLELKKEHGWEEEILCMVRTTSDISSLKGLDVKLVTADLREPGSLTAPVKGATYIFHLGAELFPVGYKSFAEANAQGTENLLKAAHEHNGKALKRFLYVSSQMAAGPSEGMEPVTEERTPPEPVAWYAETKLAGEKAAHRYMDKMPITIVRPSSVYGERNKGFVSLYTAVKMRIHAIVGFRLSYTGMVYGKDLVEGIAAAALSEKSIGETYFLTNPENYSVKDLNKTMGKAVGKPWGITIPVPVFLFWIIGLFNELISLFLGGDAIPNRDYVKVISQRFWLCSPAKAKRDLGWEAKHSLLEGMTNTAASYKREDEKLKRMASDSKGTLWLKYFCLALVVGIGFELLAAFGNVYIFSPWWTLLPGVPVFWGLVAGSATMATRTWNGLLQFLTGFLIGGLSQLGNHYAIQLWSFPTGKLFGISPPIWQAVAMGVLVGVSFLVINGLMVQLYKRRLRVG